MKKLRLIIHANLREQRRWATEHLYTILVLTPLVFGISYATVSRLTSESQEWQLTFIPSLGLCVVFVLSLIGLSLTRAAVEIYHLRRPESVLDTLPVSLATQLHAALIKRVVRTAVVALLILIVRYLAGIGRAFGPSVYLPLLLFILIVSLAEAISALNWIHWSHVKGKLTAVAAVFVTLISALLAALLLDSVFSPGIVPAWIGSWKILWSILWIVALYILVRHLHKRWRSLDIEYAKRLHSGGRSKLFDTKLLKNRLDREVAMQVARDLSLTLRAFSSAVYVALFMFMLLLIVLLTILTTTWIGSVAAVPKLFEITWLPSVLTAKAICVLAVASCSMLVAVLVTYQLPYFWLERATGATGKQIWEAKLWYTRLVSLAAPLATWLIAVLTATVPLAYAIPLLLECIWLWWIVSTLIGALAFEIPDRPELAIVLMISFGVTIGLFVATFWPVGTVLFALNGIRGLTLRGHSRATFCLITEGD